MREIYLAGGCFWGVEEYFSRIDGVVETKVGYANGFMKNPSYEQVCTGKTGHAETTYIQFDENKISLGKILDEFWSIIDPTLKNRQGADIGSQYRTGIYYKSGEDRKVILKSLKEEEEKLGSKIVTEVEPLKTFYEAEEYHQSYLKKNPDGYCHIDLDS